MKLTRKLGAVGALLAVSAGVFVACGSSDSGSGAQGAAASGGAAGADGGGGMVNPDSGSGGFFGGDSGLSGDVTSEGFDPDAACAATTLSATLAKANILFLIDRTGSMNCNPPPTQTSAECANNPVKKVGTEPSKWEITRDALIAAIQGLEGTNPLPSIGIMYFNSDGFCGFPQQPNVNVAALSGNPNNDPQLNALVLSLNGVTPKGETPIVGSTMSAYQYLNSNAASFDGNRFVVLLTDGAETCDPASKPYLIEKAGQASSLVNIRTFVLGAPGSEDGRAFLSQLAYAGGTPSSSTCDHSGAPANVGDCHMDMTLPGLDFATALQANLQAISGQALSCEFDVPTPGPGEPPVDPTKVNVKYTHGGTTEYILQDAQDPCDDASNAGWQYFDNNTKIVLCGAACDKVKNDPQASISIELGCATQSVPPK